MVDFSTYQFRCSSLGALLTDSKDAITDKQLEKIEELTKKSQLKPLTVNQFDELKKLIAKRDSQDSKLGETCIKKLIQIWVEVKTGRTKQINSKYLEKGITQENDSITLYSRVKRFPYFKNTTRLYNSFLQGEPDTFEGEVIHRAYRIIDTKTSWDAHTFYVNHVSPVNKDYDYQGQGYCGLSHAEFFNLAYCLVNAPGYMVMDEKFKLNRKLGSVSEYDEEYIAGCQEIEKNMIFDIQQFRRDNPHFDFHTKEWEFDIPMDERVIEFELKRDASKISAIYERVAECREWLNAFEQSRSKKQLEPALV